MTVELSQLSLGQVRRGLSLVALGGEKVEHLAEGSLERNSRVVEILILAQARLQVCPFLARSLDLLVDGLDFCFLREHEAIWEDCRQNFMPMLRLLQLSIRKSRALHLESEHVGQLVNPRRLGSLVALTVFLIEVVVHFAEEYVLPGAVEIVLVLNVQDDVAEDFTRCVHLFLVLSVGKFD